MKVEEMGVLNQQITDLTSQKDSKAFVIANMDKYMLDGNLYSGVVAMLVANSSLSHFDRHDISRKIPELTLHANRVIFDTLRDEFGEPPTKNARYFMAVRLSVLSTRDDFSIIDIHQA